MIDYETFCRLRQLRDEQGLKVSQIAAQLDLDPKTVAAWIERATYQQRQGKGTKHDIAVKLGERFPDELGKRVPPKRKLWQSEDSRMDMFDAVSLALMPRLKRGRLD